MQPLTVDELSLVEGLMSEKFNIPSAKETKALLKGAVSSLHREKKRKMPALPDSLVVDDPKSYRMKKVETALIQAGTPLVSASVEPSPARSTKKALSKSSEGDRVLTMNLPTEGSAYSDPSFCERGNRGASLPS